MRCVRDLVCQGVQRLDRNVVVLFGKNRSGQVSCMKWSSQLRPTNAIRNYMGVRSVTSSAKNSNENHISEEYDIIIAGGGLVGTALACLLGKFLEFCQSIDRFVTTRGNNQSGHLGFFNFS